VSYNFFAIKQLAIQKPFQEKHFYLAYLVRKTYLFGVKFAEL